MHWIERDRSGQKIWSLFPEDVPLDGEQGKNIFLSAWGVFCDHVAPLHKKDIWNICRVEFWESGLIAIYPYREDMLDNFVKAGCAIRSDSHKEFMDLRIFSDMDEATAEREMETFNSRLSDIISEAARELKLPEKLGRSEIVIKFYLANFVEDFASVTLIR